MTLQKILFPVDFSDKCRDAARAVRTLAREFRSEVIMLHVVETFDEELVYAKDDVAARMERARHQMASFLGAEFRDVQVRHVVLNGDPPVEVVNFARNEKADIIMMPTHGYGPFRRFLLGSVTAKVLHDADCPVWTGTHLGEAGKGLVSQLKTEFLDVRRVVCAVDLGPQSCKAAKWSANIAKQFGAELTLVHAVPLFTAPAPEAWPSGWQEEAMRFATDQLEGLREQLKLDCALHVLEGGPSVAIRQAVKDADADLLIIGRSTNAGMIGRLTSDAYGILCHSPCPVVSV